jgi:tRNA G18 (ribose-2'-O)-methylase SpoU
MVYNPEDKFMAWQRNVIDEFKELTQEEINSKLTERCNGFSVLMTHVEGDFNIGTVMRSANFFGAKEFFYWGRKRFDKRSTVGVHHYTSVQFLNDIESIAALKEKYTLVALENNVSNPITLNRFDWQTPLPPCIVVGEECNGIPQEVLPLCDRIVEIPNFGSVRSINVGSAASLAMYDYLSKVRLGTSSPMSA